jgi:L1 cell adhesion molecule like protein
MDNDEYILGIDLGTTYTCVGVMRNDKIEIIPNQLGNRLTPSWVSFTEKETLIGYAAKNKSISNLKNTIYCVKRIIGRNFSDPIVQNDIKLFPFKVIKNSKTNKPLIQIENKNEKKDYYPEQISSMILKHVKKYSEEFLGKKVNKAVISVPAYFNESQKKATKVAGEIAGLNVIRIINEPTAGAIAYGYGINNKLNDEKKNILVFDLGGGTYDISILKIEKNKFTVLSINGDTHLGGEDFDNKLLDFCVEQFQKETGINIKNHKNSEKALRRLKNACEKAKIELSGVKSTDIDIESLVDGKDFYFRLNRADLEDCCHTLFEKLILQ